MNLILDVGNTLIKAGFFDDQTFLKEERICPENLPLFLSECGANYILVSDVRGITDRYLRALSDKCPIIFLNHQTPLPIQNRYETPQTLGTDRIAAAIGAYFSAPNENHLVLDAGTCLTYDFIDKSGNYWGGAISMGLRMRFRALAHFTGKLPEIQDFDKPISLVGQSTEMSILSGVIHGMLGEIDYFLTHYRQKYDDFRLTICGGDANFFEKRIKASIFANSKLVLMGLNQILCYHINEKKTGSSTIFST